MTEATILPVPELPAKDLLQQLKQEFKAIGECLPLAIGIDKQLLELRPSINRKQLRLALGMHTHSGRYLKTMQTATQRFNLAGEAVGEVTDEQRSVASKELFDRVKKRNAAHKAQQQAKDQAEKAERAEIERVEKLQQLTQKFSRS